MNYVLMAVNLGVLSYSALRWPDCHRLFAYLSSSSGQKILYLEHKADGTTVCACPWARLLLSFSVEDNWKPREDREISMCLRAHLWCRHIFFPYLLHSETFVCTIQCFFQRFYQGTIPHTIKIQDNELFI